MKKKFLSAMLFGALMLGGTSTFVSCKDYDDDIKDLQTQIDDISTKLGELKYVQSVSYADGVLTVVKQDGTSEELEISTPLPTYSIVIAEGNVVLKKDGVEVSRAALPEDMDTVFDPSKLTIEGGKIKYDGVDTGATLPEDMDTKFDPSKLTVVDGVVKYDGIPTGVTIEEAETINPNDFTIVDGILNYKGQPTTATIPVFDPKGLTVGEGGKVLYNAVETGIVLPDVFNPGLLQVNPTTGMIEYNGAPTGVEFPEQVTNNDLQNNILEIKNGEEQVIGYQITIDGKTATLNCISNNFIATRLTSIVFAPDFYVDGVEAILFNSLKYVPMNEVEEPNVPYFISDNKAVAKYRLNPTGVNEGDINKPSYEWKQAVNVSTRTNGECPVSILGTTIKDGFLNVNLTKNTTDLLYLGRDDMNFEGEGWNNGWMNETDADKFYTISLKVPVAKKNLVENEKEAFVYSEYVQVREKLVLQKDLFIADNKNDKSVHHYYQSFNEAARNQATYEIAYNKDFDLGQYVKTCIYDKTTHKDLDTESFHLTYRYSLPEEYDVTSEGTVTDQQDWFNLVDGTKGIYQVDGYNREGIGRTPIVKIELIDAANGNNVVREAYVKLKVVAEKAADLSFVVADTSFVYNCLNEEYTIEVSEEEMRENVYRVISDINGVAGMSHEEFWNTYEFSTSTVSAPMVSKPEVIDGVSTQGTATKKVVWTFNSDEFCHFENVNGKFTASLELKNRLASSEYPQYVKFLFSFNVTYPTWTFAPVVNEKYWDKVVEEGENKFTAFKVNVAVPETVLYPASECIFKTSLVDAYVAELDTYVKGFEKLNCVEYAYEIESLSLNGEVYSPIIVGGVFIDEQDNICLDKTNTQIKKALNSEKGLTANIRYVAKFDNGHVETIHNFTVRFIRPINFSLPMGLEVFDAKTGGNVVDFNWNGIFTDWRDELVYAPSTTQIEKTYGYWKQVTTPGYWIPAHQEYVSGGYYKIETKEIEVETATIAYKAKAIVQCQTWNNVGYWNEWTDYREIETEKAYISENDAKLALKKLVPQNESSGLNATNYRIKEGSYEITPIPEVETVTVIESIEWIPAEYKWVEAQFVATYEPAPEVEGTANGQMIGSWMWIISDVVETINVDGQYWDFYGPFQAIKLDLNNVTTNITYNGNKLPSKTTLVQEGRTVKYVNIGAPVSEEYEIYIPATVEYGWGTINKTLTIKVKPGSGK